MNKSILDDAREMLEEKQLRMEVMTAQRDAARAVVESTRHARMDYFAAAALNALLAADVPWRDAVKLSVEIACAMLEK